MIIQSSAKIRHLQACKSAKNHKTNHAINCCHDTEVVSRMCSVKKVFLKNFAKFTGKQLCQRLIFHSAPPMAASDDTS